VSAELEPVTRTFGTTVVKDDALAAYATHATPIKYNNTNLTKIDEDKEVIRASGNPNPTKYGQLDSMYAKRLGADQSIINNTMYCYLIMHVQIYISGGMLV
jgi:hypothetical protein